LGVEYQPKFFDAVDDEYSKEKLYKFNNKYWEKRKNQDYRDFPDLFWDTKNKISFSYRETLTYIKFIHKIHFANSFILLYLW
jgi:hypothetical protein